MADLLLPHLMLGNCSDRICVRVSRFWDFCDPNDEKKLLHSDMVLIDEEGNTIHAQIYPAASQLFKQSVKEGNVYNFYYFRVKNSENYKPVANDHMLCFSKWTKIEEVVDIPPAFPMYTYSIASMEQLQERVDSRALFTDVIGVITAISNVGAIQTKMRQGQSLRRAVTIRLPSGDLLDVVLWSERATSFPAEEIHGNGQASPQIVIFVGTLVRSFGGTSLSGGSSCKWYINPEVPEVKRLMVSAKTMHKPITWAENVGCSKSKDAAEEKKVSDIINMNPFECKKNEFLVTVTVRKIDSSWWYNACKKCMKTTKRHGDSYRCTNPKCGYIGMPTQRFKLSVLAGDETGDTDFIIFGRQAQRLTKKTADTLIADNPSGFIPDEITRLLEKTFIWSVSFTESTIDSGNVTFQVNAVVGEINDGSATIPATPDGSQASSLMLSGGAGTSIQNTPQKSHALTLSSLPATSEPSLASSATPAKQTFPASEPPETPQSVRSNAHDKDKALACTANAPGDSPTQTQGGSARDEDKTLASIAHAAGGSSTKTQKSTTKKRSRPSPNKNVAKKLFISGQAGDDSGSDNDAANAPDQTSPSKDDA